MAISDYPTLKTTIAAYLHRSDLTSNIPDFIQMAEWRIARDVRITPLISDTTLSISVSASSVNLPTNFLEMVDVHQNANNKELTYVPPDHYDRVLTNGPNVGIPWVYTLKGNTLNIAPPPSSNGVGVISAVYYRKEEALNDTSATSWFTTNAPDILLYATLLESSPFLINDERISVWQSFYDRALGALNQQYGVLDPHLRMMRQSQPIQTPTSREPK